MAKAIFPRKLKQVPAIVWVVLILILIVVSIFVIYVFVAVLGLLGVIILFAALNDDWFY